VKIHILGICGTFMGGLAALARADGHEVSGSDENVYPPMSTQLEALGIEVTEGYDPSALDPAPDLVLIGNALSRGNPCVEHVLNSKLPYASGPGWLGANYLAGRRVMAVAGTHGKTSTASMLAWILESAGKNPGFLIGGVPNNFGVSARSSDDLFVVEADEYDTAFFDKRAKFIHYRPTVAILNNLEFDHADIYTDLAAIQQQFHHFVRIIAGNSTIVVNGDDSSLKSVLDKGCWSKVQRFSLESEAEWQVELAEPAGRELVFKRGSETVTTLTWSLTGRHNAMNAMAAIAAAAEVGVDAADAACALSEFKGVKRRLELLGEVNGARVYDDFAHHPTAIRLTLEGLRRSVGGARILVALEPASNTMRSGYHVNELAPALMAADHVWIKTSEAMDWDPGEILAKLDGQGRPRRQVDNLLKDLREAVRPGDHVVFMSNKGFSNAPHRFVEGRK
jgi:UDP-N-acetylmuramate: L-alanyl-gamma-D-glutamyl-meso-diaminopimelate ligase